MHHQGNCELCSQTRLQGGEPNDVIEHSMYLGILKKDNNKMVKQETAFIKTISVTTWWEIGLQVDSERCFCPRSLCYGYLYFYTNLFLFGLSFYF